MDKKFQGVANNAKIARKLQSEMQADDKFNRTFHIRPNIDSFTIVSTLPVAPMRGLVCKTEAKLKTELEFLHREIDSFCTEDDKKVLAKLKERGFKRRGGERPDIAGEKAKTQLEEDIQVRFIRSMLAGEPDYKGIEFVASEFIIQYGDKTAGKKVLRADVVGFDAKNQSLWVFELKKGRETGAIRQVMEYVDIICAEINMFSEIISNHPNVKNPPAVLNADKIVPVTVMRHAENLKEEKYRNQMALHPRVRLWFFKDALAIQEGF